MANFAKSSRGRKKYGFKTILLDESGKIPVHDHFFDIVFCNSAIEHITMNKNEVFQVVKGKIYCCCVFQEAGLC
jgi:hypothetical protein